MRRLLPALVIAAFFALRLEAATVVLLPLENLSGVDRARELVSAEITSALASKGYTVVRGEEVESVLESERIRHLDSLTEASRAALCRRFDAERIFLGTIDAFAEGEVPIVELHARLIGADGRPMWSAVAGRTGDDTEGAFGNGRVSDVDVLAGEATRRLLRGVPAAGQGPRAEKAPGSPFLRSGPATWKTAALSRGPILRVCVLPLENRSRVREAPRVVGPLLERRLAGSGAFEVVEAADLRAAMVRESVASLRDMNPASLQRLGRRLGTTLFVRGAIDAYRDASPHGADVTPEVAVEVSLVDVAASRILWTSQHARKGRSYEGLLGRGSISNAAALADRTVAEMVHAVAEGRSKVSAQKEEAERP